ncbi:MAG TPA: hypothetical protein PLH15_05280 [Spirochaetota bacterium]|nr:hypothetical protein [Spirochaetota bacterium]HQQ23233.1 hypothetical protein [Spirochaetota bacterium]
MKLKQQGNLLLLISMNKKICHVLLLFAFSGFSLISAGDVAVLSDDKPSVEKIIKENIEKLGISPDISVRVRIYKFSSQSEIFSVKGDSLSIEKGMIEIAALLTVIENKNPHTMHIIKANGKSEKEAVSELLRSMNMILIKFK